MTTVHTSDDLVTRLIRYCHLGPDHAEKMFNKLTGEGCNHVELGGEELPVSKEEIGEFVARYSAEVEPTLWESKRLKH